MRVVLHGQLMGPGPHQAHIVPHQLLGGQPGKVPKLLTMRTARAALLALLCAAGAAGAEAVLTTPALSGPALAFIPAAGRHGLLKWWEGRGGKKVQEFGRAMEGVIEATRECVRA